MSTDAAPRVSDDENIGASFEPSQVYQVSRKSQGPTGVGNRPS